MGVVLRSQYPAVPRLRIPVFPAALLLCVLVAWRCCVAQSDTPPAVVTGNGEGAVIAVGAGQHLWCLGPMISAGQRRTGVYHHGPGMPEGELRLAFVLEDAPQAAAAIDADVYFVFSPRTLADGTPMGRMISTGDADAFDPNRREWVYGPGPRPRSLAELPGQGTLAGMAALDQELLALIDPDGLRSVQVSQPGQENQRQVPILKRLHLGEWLDVALPAEVGAKDHVRLVPGDEPKLLVRTDGNEMTDVISVYALASDLTWQHTVVDLGTRHVVAATSVLGQTVLLLGQTRSSRGPLEIDVLRHGKLYPIAMFEGDGPHMGLVTIADQPAIVRPAADGNGFDVVAYDLETGKAQPVQRFARRVLPRLEDFSLLVLIFALLLATIVMYLFRPAESSKIKVEIPRGYVISEPRRRLLALVIDLFPSAIVAGLILQLPINSMFSISRFPMLANQWQQAWPTLLMLILTIGHETVGELLTGRSVGKWIVNCRVISVSGQYPGVVATLVRNLMKFIALLVPVLFLFVYLNPFRQHLGDLVGRCIVVTAREDAGKPQPEDQDGP